MRILITGSRDWADRDAIESAIMSAIWNGEVYDYDSTVVHGGARGADGIAGNVARVEGLNVEVHHADWSKGKAAGILRNLDMVKAGADVCLAFIKDGSAGATHCAKAAEKAGIETRRYVT